MESVANVPGNSPAPELQSSKELSNDELRQEADGLFAGIAYLNQTEQIEDNVVDNDDDNEEEETEFPECGMGPELENKEPGFEVVPTAADIEGDRNPSRRKPIPYPWPSPAERWTSFQCSISCRDNECCHKMQRQYRSNCLTQLLYHWIEAHGETTVKSNDGQSLIWLCPVPSCGSSFTSKEALVAHSRGCNQADTVNGFYWCNAHDSFEHEVSYEASYSPWASPRHQILEAPSSTNLNVLTYKFTRVWPTLEEFQPDPQFCEHCKDRKYQNLFTPEEILDHVFGQHISGLRACYLTDLEYLEPAARSYLRDVARLDPAIASVLGQAEARYTDHLITEFSKFLEAQDIDDRGIGCGCETVKIRESLHTFSDKNTLNQLLSNIERYQYRYRHVGYAGFVPTFISPTRHDLNDIGTILEHWCSHHTHRQLRKPTNSQLQHALSSVSLQNSLRHFKHRREMLRVVKQLQDEVTSTRASCQYLLATAGAIYEIRVRLIIDIGTLLESLDSRLRQNPTSPLPGDLYEDLQRAERLLDEFFASPNFMDTSGSSEDLKLSANLTEERRKLRAMLGRMAPLDRSDQMLPRDRQWGNLRSLRYSSSMFHSQILSLTGREGRQKCGLRQRVVIRRLRQQIKSSSDFLVTGILTFRKVLQGIVPSTLEEVLAFVSLSHVMSEELWFKGKMTEPMNFNAGFPGWMRAIRSKAEQAAFQELAIRLWPESALAFESVGGQSEDIIPAVTLSDIPIPYNTAAHYPTADHINMTDVLSQDGFPICLEPLQCSNNMELPYLDAVTAGLPAWSDVSAGSFHNSTPLSQMMDTSIDALPYFKEPIQQLLAQSHSSDDFHFSDFLDIRHWENFPGQLPESAPSAPSVSADSEPRIIEVEAEVSLNDNEIFQSTTSIDPRSNGLETNELEEDENIVVAQVVDDRDPESGVLAILCATTIFQIVLTYMNYICSLGDLLTYLAGNFNRSRSYNTVSTSLSLRENGVQILIKVIHPLLTNHELGELKHAVGVTSVMLQQGLLTCLHEVDEYLIHLGRLFARSTGSYMSLVSKSLRYMRAFGLESLNSIRRCGCGSAHCSYTGKEIQSREAEQAQWANERFAKGLDHIAIEEVDVLAWTPAVAALEESPSSSDTVPPFSSVQTYETGSSSHSRGPSASASSAHISPPSEAADTLSCDTCAAEGIVKRFNGPDAVCNLRRHTREQHEGKKFTCPSCHMSFSRLHNLRTHWTRKHKGVDMPASLEARGGSRRALSHRVSPY